MILFISPAVHPRLNAPYFTICPLLPSLHGHEDEWGDGGPVEEELEQIAQKVHRTVSPSATSSQTIHF